MKTTYTLTGVLLLAPLLACQPDLSLGLDKPQTCHGTEETRVMNTAEARAGASRQSTRLTVDFHQRLGHVFIKSTAADILPARDGLVHFVSRQPAFWLAGQFNPMTGELRLVSQRQLEVNGVTQTISSTGQFACPVRAV